MKNFWHKYKIIIIAATLILALVAWLRYARSKADKASLPEATTGGRGGGHLSSTPPATLQTPTPDPAREIRYRSSTETDGNILTRNKRKENKTRAAI